MSWETKKFIWVFLKNDIYFFAEIWNQTTVSLRYPWISDEEGLVSPRFSALSYDVIMSCLLWRYPFNKEFLWERLMKSSYQVVSFFAYTLSDQSLILSLRPLWGDHKVKTIVTITQKHHLSIFTFILSSVL